MPRRLLVGIALGVSPTLTDEPATDPPGYLLWGLVLSAGVTVIVLALLVRNRRSSGRSD